MFNIIINRARENMNITRFLQEGVDGVYRES